LERVMGIEPT